ncbi:MAG: glycine cleavage system aminomethyltransferase GcvT [Hyphomicrobiales bacterium]|nr:glycine cleavage system aminomethyltransferase GcvT [Hyphomicrobiales bacterium]
MSDSATLRTPLHALHVELGARMAPFAGYDMPIQYPQGILAEHLHTRLHAGLFDVSHMGQARLDGPDHATVARALEALCPADILGLAQGRQRYTQFLNAEGGVIDDLMVSRPQGADGRLNLVVNAARKAVDYAFLDASLPAEVRLTRLDDAALIAVQGPASAAALARAGGEELLAAMPFMSVRPARFGRFETYASRSGYTGEDGFEISLPAADADAFARRLLQEDDIHPIGLGARDSLRLEAGLSLYGHELDETTDPIEAGLTWSIQKRRRLEGGFPGAARIQAALAAGPARRLVGLRPEGRGIAREGAEIVDAEGRPIGRVTSGGFGPSVGAPIAMGYVASGAATDGPLALMVRGKPLEARIVPLPFHPHAYYRG